MSKNMLFRNIPKVDVLLENSKIISLIEKYNREVVVDAIRDEIDKLRSFIKENENLGSFLYINLYYKNTMKDNQKIKLYSYFGLKLIEILNFSFLLINDCAWNCFNNYSFFHISSIQKIVNEVEFIIRFFNF